MEPFIPKKTKRGGPEAKIQEEICDMLTLKGWFVKNTHGNLFQFGLPDVFACHTRYGHRWIEVKNPVKFSFTSAQIETFPKLCANGSGVWILVAATEAEYNKIFKPYNWHLYLPIMK